MLQYSWTMTLVLMIRILCRYLGIVNIFLGNNDKYGTEGIYYAESLSDGILWAYFILLCLYSPQATQKYSRSHITNILAEYPWLKIVSELLKILKGFNWVSYIMLSLIILSREPSCYVLLHIIFLIVVVAIEIMPTDQVNRNTLLRWVWVINFYITTFIIFTKYFYLLQQYDVSSSLVLSILEFLSAHQHIIGLAEIP